MSMSNPNVKYVYATTPALPMSSRYLSEEDAIMNARQQVEAERDGLLLFVVRIVAQVYLPSPKAMVERIESRSPSAESGAEERG